MVEKRKIVDILVAAQVETLYANMINENNKGLEALFPGVVENFRSELAKSNKFIKSEATMRRGRVDEMFFLWHDVENFFVLVHEFTKFDLIFLKSRFFEKGIFTDRNFVDRCHETYGKIQKSGRTLMRILDKLIEDMQDDPFLWRTILHLRRDCRDIGYCLKRLEED